MRVPISVVIITKNEAANIARCLEAVTQVSDDVWILDSYSTDETVAICKSMQVNVLQHEWLGYAGMKNWGNKQCKNDWILSIDADEVLSEALIQQINKATFEAGSVYFLDRMTNYEGHWVKYSGWYPDWKPRIFNRHEAAWTGDFVHEKLSFSVESMQKVKLKGLLYHFSYPTKAHHKVKIAQYAKLGAEELFQRGKKSSFLKRYFSPLFRFVKTYFIKLGILDGKTGFTIALFDASLVYQKYHHLHRLNQKTTT